MSHEGVLEQGEHEWLLVSSQVYWDHLIAGDFLRLAHPAPTSRQ
jgi:hypothetical protein